MRNKLISIWRKLVRIKLLTPIIKFIRYLAATNIFNIVLDYIEVHVIGTSYEESKHYFKKNKKRIKENLLVLEDKKSKNVYMSLINYRSSHNRDYLKKIVDKEQYFDERIIQFSSNLEEGFLDCGAYKGDTIKAYLKNRGKKNNKDFIWALEPDRYNFKCLKKNTKKIKNIALYNIGTWSDSATLRFCDSIEEACKVSEDGETLVKVDSIDHILEKENRRVTYIKMDIEGAELESLRGADKIIEAYRPRLAISIYHSDEDMIGIIEYIRKEYPFYSLYVRHYTYFYADTVLYAINKQED